MLSAGDDVSLGASVNADRSKSFHDRKISVWFKHVDHVSKGTDEITTPHILMSPLTPTQQHISIKKSNESLLPAAKINFYHSKRQNATHESAHRKSKKGYIQRDIRS